MTRVQRHQQKSAHQPLLAKEPISHGMKDEIYILSATLDEIIIQIWYCVVYVYDKSTTNQALS